MNKQKRANIILDELKQLYPHPKSSLNFSNNWELLVAVILSAQTTDKHINTVTETLFIKYPTLIDYVQADLDELTQDLSSVNYYKTKAKHIHTSAQIIHTEFDGRIPKTVKELLILPGVGRKTALVTLAKAYNITYGIAIDTHVNRLTRLFGLTDQTTPEKIEQDLKQLFPKEEWNNITNRLIDYGREHCPARCTHNECPILKKIVLAT